MKIKANLGNNKISGVLLLGKVPTKANESLVRYSSNRCLNSKFECGFKQANGRINKALIELRCVDYLAPNIANWQDMVHKAVQLTKSAINFHIFGIPPSVDSASAQELSC